MLILFHMRHIPSQQVAKNSSRFLKKRSMFQRAYPIKLLGRLQKFDHKFQTALMKPHWYIAPDCSEAASILNISKLSLTHDGWLNLT